MMMRAPKRMSEPSVAAAPVDGGEPIVLGGPKKGSEPLVGGVPVELGDGTGYVVTRVRGGRHEDLVACGQGDWEPRREDGRVSDAATVFLSEDDAAFAIAVAARFHGGGARVTRVDAHNTPIDRDPRASRSL